MKAAPFLLFDLPSDNEIFSRSGFTIPGGQLAPGFLLISHSVFLAFHFPQAYNLTQPRGWHGFTPVQFPNLT